MCGIAGLAGLIDSLEVKRAVHRMTLALARRGPDGEGMACWHSLAIIDGSCWIPGPYTPLKDLSN